MFELQRRYQFLTEWEFDSLYGHKKARQMLTTEERTKLLEEAHRLLKKAGEMLDECEKRLQKRLARRAYDKAMEDLNIGP